MIKKPSTDTGLVEAPTVVFDDPLSREIEIPAPVPRKRGRPRKTSLSSEQEATASSSRSVSAVTEAPAPTPEASEAPAPAPRKRGRPRKSALSEQETVDSAPLFAPASVAAEVPAPAPRKRGRPRKSALSEQNATAFSPAAASEGAEASVRPEPASPAKAPGKDPGAASDRSGEFAAPFFTREAAGRPGRSNGGYRNNQNGGSGGQGGKGKGGGYQNAGRRPRRNYSSPREQVVPQTSREDLAGLKMAELRVKAVELELDISAIRKKEELVEAVLDAVVKAEGFVACEGILDLLPEGYGFLRTSGYLPGESDVYVGMSMVRRNGLRKGDLVTGQVRPARENEKYAALHRIDAVNGLTLDDARSRRRFSDLTPVYPDERLLMEHGIHTLTARTIDLVAPIGKGQRGLIVSPPKAGKTTILKDIAASISDNNPDVHLMCLLVDERPEEVTDMERSIKGEVVSSTFDMPSENHIAVAELVIERAKRLVEGGRDVVILLDSITRLARAYNLAQPASGRILSGGVDSTALYPPKRFLGAARNIEGGGSLTILASALIETGSKMDEVIFEEFKGTGNMELRLDRDLADRRIFPAIDPVASGTRKEELLLDSQEAPLIWAVRRILANMNNTERAMEMLIKSLKQTQNNAEFLMRTAKKAQQRSNVEIAEL
jgi:transcription termination factor Rho